MKSFLPREVFLRRLHANRWPLKIHRENLSVAGYWCFDTWFGFPGAVHSCLNISEGLPEAQWSLQTYDDDCSLTCEIEQFFSFRLRFITIRQQKRIILASLQIVERWRISRFYRRNDFSCGTNRFLWGDGTCIDKTWISRNLLRCTFGVNFWNFV